MKTICAAFWKHFNVRSGDDIYPCCRYKTPVAKFDGDLEKVLHLPVFEKLRQDSLNGIYNPNCQKCYDSVHPQLNPQEFFNSKYQRDSVSLEFLEIGFDNICNLTCDGCSGVSSSAWADIENPVKEKKINIRSTSEITKIPDTVRKILFLGGEPLMTNRHKTLLKKVTHKALVRVIYNTNGTFLLDDETIDLLRQFEHAKFVLSIDGYGQLNDRVRSGSSWPDILEFIDQIRDLDFELEIHTVVHANNYFGMLELETFIKSLGLPQRVQLLTRPSKLDIRYLEESKKTQFIKDLENSNSDVARIILSFIKKT